MKKVLSVSAILVVSVLLTGCNETFEERVELKRKCQEAGGYYWEGDFTVGCNLTDGVADHE